MPKVSVIIPIYNVEKYLEQCIESIRNQTIGEIEIILIEDGSPDKSGQICDEYAKKDSRIRVFHKQNEGVSLARNLGIEKATGEWISFMDPDDWAEPTMIEKALKIAIKEKADIVQWNSYYNTPKGQTPRKAIYPEIIRREQKEIELLELDILSTVYEEVNTGISVGPIRGVWGKLYRKEMIKENRFNKDLYAFEDGIFNLCVFENAKTIVLVNEYLHHYRVNENSVCNSYKETWIQQNEKILQEVEKIIKAKQNVEFTKIYLILACELFSTCLSRCIFHKDNPANFSQRLEMLKQYIGLLENKKVLDSVDTKYLNRKQKLLIFLAKRKHMYSIAMIYGIKKVIKR